MKTDWQDEFDKEFQVKDVYGFDVITVNNANIYKHFIQSLLDKQKGEIIEMVEEELNENCSDLTCGHEPDRVINKIKEI
ncbi:hypothetical protein EKK58_06120 [Candidatus Dependentiae bacterium]|nr:MAG: hypothetical protein EKK58_06120 [Candidatus Dependentiae bacterium]